MTIEREDNLEAACGPIEQSESPLTPEKYEHLRQAIADTLGELGMLKLFIADSSVEIPSGHNRLQALERLLRIEIELC